MNKVLTIILILGLMFSFETGCVAKKSRSFIIETGNKSSQLGFKRAKGDMRAKGPIAIALYKDKIFILGEVNSKVNIYTLKGKYIKTINLPKDSFYYNLSVSSQGNIMVVTDEGVKKVLRDNSLKKVYELPKFINTPYQFSTNKKGNFVMSGLSSHGRLNTGMLKNKKDWKQLEGFRVLTSQSGVIGLQSSHNSLKLFKKKRKIKISIPKYAVPIGITNNLKVYCVKSGGNNYVKLCKINQSGIINSRKINYDGKLVKEPINIIKFFKVYKEKEIIALEANPEKIKIIKF